MSTTNLFLTPGLRRYAVDTLFGRYGEFKTEKARKICEELQIEIVEDAKLPPAGGELIFRAHARFEGGTIYVIHISTKAELEEMREFIIYHELAHFFLSMVGISPSNKEEYWVCESWCDNFSLAMLLSCFGCEGMNAENFPAFLEEGSELRGGKERSRNISLRLSHYCKGAVWADHPSELPPLMRLAQKLLE